MMDLPPQLPHQSPPAIEWLHVMPPTDSADLVLGYEAAYPFLHAEPTSVDVSLLPKVL